MQAAKTERHPDDGWPVIAFATAAELESWLQDHCEDETGFWVKVAKKTSGIESVTSNEVIELGLCFGWVDNKTKGIDDHYYGMRFQPRRPKSNWSSATRESSSASRPRGVCAPPGRPRWMRPKPTAAGTPPSGP